MNTADIRKEYTKGSLDPKSLNDNPIEVFREWFDQAVLSDAAEVNAMVLSTVGLKGRPSSRVVLMKEITVEGIVFFTNYASRKGKELAENGFVSVVFFWPELERQVRMEGVVHKISEADSDAYFYSRPRISQAGAVVSNQSEEISDRSELDIAMQRLLEDESIEIKRPAHWGGYEIILDAVEFWQGRPGRVHDRAKFKKENGVWDKCRLSP